MKRTATNSILISSIDKIKLVPAGGVEALRNDSGVSVTSTKGKLKVLQSLSASRVV